MTETIKCQLCNKEFQKITNTHLKRIHPEYTIDRYKEEFGENSLMSDDWRWIQSQITQDTMEQRVATHADTTREKMSEIATQFTNEEWQVVVGGLLGDSWIFQPQQINYNTGAGGGYLSMQHCLRQVPYMAWKARLLTRFQPVLRQRFYFNTVKSRFDVQHQVDTIAHFLFGDIAKSFYPESENFKKVLPIELIENLDALGLAIWYQDDGNGKTGYFCTNCFTESSLSAAANILTAKFGLAFKVASSGDDFYLRIASEDKQAFFDLIESHIHHCMRYKIDKESLPVVKVTKQLKFIYGHYLLDYEGDCSRSHGHNALVNISVKGPINPDTGFVEDFGDIKAIAQPLLDSFDHYMLNDLEGCLAIKATAENISVFLAATLRLFIPNLHSIEVYETPTSWTTIVLDDSANAFLEEYLARISESGEWWQDIQTRMKSSVWPDEVQPPRGKKIEEWKDNVIDVPGKSACCKR